MTQPLTPERTAWTYGRPTTSKTAACEAVAEKTRSKRNERVEYPSRVSSTVVLSSPLGGMGTETQFWKPSGQRRGE
jgi:hypothetical protein